MKRLISIIAIVTGLTTAGALAQDAKQDMKTAGQDTKDAAKNTGKGVAHATKTTGRKVKHTTKKAVNESAKATENGAAKVDAKTTGHE
jgi:Ni/Co efflux regulator RcnB